MCSNLRRSSLRTLLRDCTAIAIAVGCCSAARGARSEEVPFPLPDGIVKVSATVLGAGVGYGWGRGTLYYQGQSIGFCVRGLSIGSLGAARLTIDGVVYNLTSPDEFPGRYLAFSLGVAAGRGEAAAFMKNKRGVVMEVELKERGVRVNVAATGVRVLMAGSRGCSPAKPESR